MGEVLAQVLAHFFHKDCIPLFRNLACSERRGRFLGAPFFLTIIHVPFWIHRQETFVFFKFFITSPPRTCDRALADTANMPTVLTWTYVGKDKTAENGDLVVSTALFKHLAWGRC